MNYSIMWGRRLIFCKVFYDFRTHLRISPDSFYFIKYNYSSAQTHLEELFDKHKEHKLHKKIIYNDVLVRKTRHKEGKEIKTEPEDAEPIFMKYLSPNVNSVSADNTKEADEIVFPYDIRKKFLNQPTYDRAVTDTVPQSILDNIPMDSFGKDKPKWRLKRIKVDKENLENPRKWNYLDEDYNDSQEFSFEFADCDPSEPVSSVPCGGCGALLHCQDVSIPGFIPKEAFENKGKEELEKEVCQRCLFLREFDVALGVNVSPSEYPEMLKQIKKRNCLAIIMIDLLDFPCSFWPGILEIIGPSKPVVVVGNKIDLIKQEDPEFLNHLKKCLLSSLVKEGLNLKNVKHVSLISAKTGFGVNMLIDHLFKNWEYRGDVFLIGCTNVGKSTLFNALIRSDYCSIKIQNVLHKATVSAWPGTTLKLLKFPITRPSLWHMVARKSSIDNDPDNSFEPIPFQGLSKLSLIKDSKEIDMTKAPKAFNPENFDVNRCRWCFDTPGVVNGDQIINFLTTSELLLTLPKTRIIPRTFHLKPGTTLFIGGLARLDYVDGPDFTWFTVYSSHELPVTVTNVEDADVIYELLLGSVLFRVPMGGKERLAKWPKLSSETLEISGKIRHEADADIVLSSAGWVAVNTELGLRCKIRAWTPEGKGIYVRDTALIKTGHRMRGAKIKKTPAFRVAEEN